jgi:hypothetical protein
MCADRRGRKVTPEAERCLRNGPDRRVVVERELSMTATSVLIPTAVTRSVNTVQRAVVILFVIVAIAAAAFFVGRATVDARPGSSVIAPVSTPVPSATGNTPVVCRIGPC